MQRAGKTILFIALYWLIFLGAVYLGEFLKVYNSLHFMSGLLYAQFAVKLVPWLAAGVLAGWLFGRDGASAHAGWLHLAATVCAVILYWTVKLPTPFAGGVMAFPAELVLASTLFTGWAFAKAVKKQR